MNLIIPAASIPDPRFPDSDGNRMADNTLQAQWMSMLYGNLSAQYRAAADVFVAMDLLWYTDPDHPEARIAPDVLLAFGRPKGYRGSYKQWLEGGVPLTVVFEILSPSNTVTEMDDKFVFYEDHGVVEYYVYDPEHPRLMAFVRRGEFLRRVRPVQGFVSPRLGIRFDLSGPELVVYGPDGHRFLTFEELKDEQERDRQERQAAEQRASSAEQRAHLVQQRAQRLAGLMRRVLSQQATPEEVLELQRLLEQGGQLD
jgi:Uma2 family endonuclease